MTGQPVGAPVPASADLTLLAVSEPYPAGGQLTMTFQIKTASGSGSLPPDTIWFTSFRNASNVAYAVRMVTDSLGAPRFEAYKVRADSNGNYRGDFVDGTAVAALAGSGYAPATGVITIIVRASDIGVTAAGQSITSLLAISSKLAVVLSQPLDLMPDSGIGAGSVQTVPVSQCGPNQSPVAILSASSIGQRKSLNVHFDASRSYDPDAVSSDPQLRDTIVKYVFDFGDGSAPVATTSPTIDHQYQQGGQYGVTFRVQDSRGKASDSAAVKQICDKCMKYPIFADAGVGGMPPHLRHSADFAVPQCVPHDAECANRPVGGVRLSTGPRTREAPANPTSVPRNDTSSSSGEETRS